MAVITLVDYLRVVGNKKATGCLRVACRDGRRGEVFVENGAIVYATVPDMTSGVHTVAVMAVWDAAGVEWIDGVAPPARPFRVEVGDVLKRIAVAGGEGRGGENGQADFGGEALDGPQRGAGERAVRPQHWCLELVNTAKQGMRLALDKPEVRIGRGRGNDITILHPSVSRNHCMFVVNGERIRVVDRGSSNGTMVDGRPVTEALLSSGCEVHLGQCHFRLTYEECEVERATTPVVLFETGRQGTEQVLQQG